MKNFLVIFFLALVGFGIASTLKSSATKNLSPILSIDSKAQLEQYLEEMRTDLKIPGMSVAIAKEDSIFWSKGFGWADKENQIPVTEKSIFHLASLTKPYATAVILQLAQEGKIDLNSSVSNYGIDLENKNLIKVKHLLSHTSSGEPGTVFKYDGYRFGELEKVIQKTTGNSFSKELAERILVPINLSETAPNPLDTIAFKQAGGDMTLIKMNFVTEYARKWGRIFWPSGLFGPLKPIDSPEYFGTAAGLVATANDVARFSIALDNKLILNDSLYKKNFTPTVSSSKETLPFGIGWFVEDYKGKLIAWQYGHWFGSSSLLIKIPEEKITFVILANSDGLSRRTKIGDKATIQASPVAPIILEKLISEEFFISNKISH